MKSNGGPPMTLIEYFNSQNLPVQMSFGGKTTILQVQFTNTVNEEQIIEFQKAHSENDCFCSHGRFAMRTFYLMGEVHHSWNYFALNWSTALKDLEEWERLDTK